MKHSAIITHKAGFPVEVFINWESGDMELHKLGENQYYKGTVEQYNKFEGNMQSFVNAHNF